MPDWLTSPWLWLLGVLHLFALARWVGYHPAPSSRPRAETPAIYAWCIHRDGDDCTHPGSPQAGQICGPVCVGRLPCQVREVRR